MIESLNAKLNACVGKYRTMFAMLPRQNEPKPCSAETRVKQFTMRVVEPTSPDMICFFFGKKKEVSGDQ